MGIRTNSNIKTKAAALSVASNSFLILLKIVAGILTGSISLIAEAIHSSMDLIAAIIALFCVSISDKVADKEHPFGHGKAENISGVAEGILIFVAAGIIIYEAIQKIIFGTHLEMVEIGLGIMVLSIVLNTLVSRYLVKIAKKTDSLALEADSKHLTTDVLTMIGVLLGLALARITGWQVFDPIAAILVAVFIFKAAYDIVKKSFGGLMDTRLPEAEEAAIMAIINDHANKMAGFHEMRTRKSGAQRFLDLHLELPRQVSLQAAHEMCDHLEKDIEQRFPHIDVTIHTEPCSADCRSCSMVCNYREKY